jgi:predicted anti-sigma-YlaC factor YlaD
MAEKCDFNKNLLLEKFFGEIDEKSGREVHNHLEHCPECREYLRELGALDDSLQLLEPERPAPWTMEKIMERIPPPQPKRAAHATGDYQVPLSALLKIILCLAFMIGVLLLINWKVTTLAFWGQVRDWWFVRAFGSLGFTAVALFLIGGAISLVLLPVFILDSKGGAREYHYVK